MADLDLAKGRKTWVVRYMLIDLAFFSGLTVSELANLKIGDIILEDREPCLIFRSSKTGITRTVYIDTELTKHLKSYISLKRTTFGEATETDSPLFVGNNDNKVPPITLMKSFKVAIKNAGLPEHFSISSARHTYATYLIQDCKNLRFVQKQLGHVNMSMTALYSDIIIEEDTNLALLMTRD